MLLLSAQCRNHGTKPNLPFDKTNANDSVHCSVWRGSEREKKKNMRTEHTIEYRLPTKSIAIIFAVWNNIDSICVNDVKMEQERTSERASEKAFIK